MKNIFATIILMLPALMAYGQGDPVNDLFEKYAGKDGITTVTISSRMFSMIAQADFDDEELSQVLDNRSGIRIKTVSDSLLNLKINFYKEIAGKLEGSKYEELMSVNEGGKDLKFYIRPKGNKVGELLMIGGGKDGNVVISIRGTLDMKNISKISKSMGFNELDGLDTKDNGKKK